MMVAAKKIREVEPFVTPPQQSDYVAVWVEKTARESKQAKSPRVADSAAKSLAKRISRSADNVAALDRGPQDARRVQFSQQKLLSQTFLGALPAAYPALEIFAGEPFQFHHERERRMA